MISVNPNCCFCGNCYSADLAKYTGFLNHWNVSKNDQYDFFRWSTTCRVCTETVITQKQNRIRFNSFSSKITTSPFKNDNGIFFPNVDKDLIPRFVSMLEEYEKFSLILLSSKEALKFVELKPLIVAENMKISNLWYYFPTFEDSSCILVTERFEVFNLCQKSNVEKLLYNKLFTSIASRTLIVKAKFIQLQNVEISTENFYLLLSSKTAELKLNEVHFVPATKFLNILKCIPNVESFEIGFTNIKYDNLWTKQLNDCKALKEFNLLFKCLNIPQEVLMSMQSNPVRTVLDLEKIDQTLFKHLSSFTVVTDGRRLNATKNEKNKII